MKSETIKDVIERWTIYAVQRLERKEPVSFLDTSNFPRALRVAYAEVVIRLFREYQTEEFGREIYRLYWWLIPYWGKILYNNESYFPKEWTVVFFLRQWGRRDLPFLTLARILRHRIQRLIPREDFDIIGELTLYETLENAKTSRAKKFIFPFYYAAQLARNIKKEIGQITGDADNIDFVGQLEEFEEVIEDTDAPDMNTLHFIDGIYCNYEAFSQLTRRERIILQKYFIEQDMRGLAIMLDTSPRRAKDIVNDIIEKIKPQLAKEIEANAD